MKKHIFNRAFFGFCVGITVCQSVVILINFLIRDETFVAVIPQLRNLVASDRVAFLVQFVWSGLIGVTFAEASLLFELERWGTLRQYLVHFIVTGVVYLPFVMLCYLPVRLENALFLLGNIILTYGITYFLQHLADRRTIRQINEALERRRNVQY